MVALRTGVPGAGVGEGLQQGQRIRQRMLGAAHPAHRAVFPGQPGRRYQHIGTAAVPAQPRMLVHGLGVAVQLAGPPLVLVLGGAPGEGEQQHASVVALGDRPDLDTGGEQPLHRLPTGLQGHVEHVVHHAGRGDEVGLGLMPGPALDLGAVGGGLRLPGERHRVPGGVGQPTRSQEQRYPAGCAAGARGSPAPAAASSRSSRPPSPAASLGRRPRSHEESLPCRPLRPPNSALIYPLASPSCAPACPIVAPFPASGSRRDKLPWSGLFGHRGASPCNA